LAYTDSTCGKKFLVLIGQRKALAMTVRNHENKNRFSGLMARLTTKTNETLATNAGPGQEVDPPVGT